LSPYSGKSSLSVWSAMGWGWGEDTPLDQFDDALSKLQVMYMMV